MLPIFGDDRKRQINLGGVTSNTSQATILDRAKTRRLERQELKRRQDSATRLQAWWRGVRQTKEIRKELCRTFESDVTGITGLRCLVLMGRNNRALRTWSKTMIEQGEGTLFVYATGPQSSSWLVLIRQVSYLLLRSVAEDPRSSNSTAHLKVLNALLTPAITNRFLGSQGTQLSTNVALYLLSRKLLLLLSQAILEIPVEKKSSPSLPLLLSLVTETFVLLQHDTQSFLVANQQLYQHILTIPVLPNRIPLTALSQLSVNLPLSSIDIIEPVIQSVVLNLNSEEKVHLIANLVAFMPPRYPKLTSAALLCYSRLLSKLMNSLPTNALDPPSPIDLKLDPGAWVQPEDSESDSESDLRFPTAVSAVDSFQPKPRLPALDDKTRKRLQTLPSPAHLSALLSATQHHPSTRPAIALFVMSLVCVWPGAKDRVLSTVSIHAGGGIVREFYREYVRGAPIGTEVDATALLDHRLAHHWPPLVFLAELYSQALLTMGDDEFFSGPNAKTTGLRNPLTVDEVSAFSRKLLNISFTLFLYWRDEMATTVASPVTAFDLRWDHIRDKITRCLQAIHARDSRKPFTPPDHWLVSSQIDMQSFIDAAIFEEQGIAKPLDRPLSKRQVAYLSPQLGVLNNIPFAIPFETRVSIFRHFVANDMIGGDGRLYHRSYGTPVSIRRGFVAQDGFDRLLEANLKRPIEIAFIDKFGQQEAGIDGGGVFKEFFTSLCKEVFDTDRGLWVANKKNELYPNPHTYATESHNLSWFRFIGRILGKAMYEGILVEIVFAGFFLAKWLGKQSFLDDLASLDPELYQGLVFLKNYSGNLEDLSLNFTVAIEEFGVAESRDLIPNGSNVAVTRENRLQYIQLVAHYRLTKQIKKQSDAFFEGLSEVIDPKWLRMFNQQEVQVLLGGVNSPIDLDDLRQNTHYGGVYDADEVTIELFWKVVNGFDQEQRKALLRFVTSCSRPPLLGFKELIPNFAIRDAGNDQNRLPTSSTCFNLLKLPRYKSEDVLRQKLLQAISSNAGFDLS